MAYSIVLKAFSDGENVYSKLKCFGFKAVQKQVVLFRARHCNYLIHDFFLQKGPLKRIKSTRTCLVWILFDFFDSTFDGGKPQNTFLRLPTCYKQLDNSTRNAPPPKLPFAIFRLNYFVKNTIIRHNYGSTELSSGTEIGEIQVHAGVSLARKVIGKIRTSFFGEVPGFLFLSPLDWLRGYVPTATETIKFIPIRRVGIKATSDSWFYTPGVYLLPIRSTEKQKSPEFSHSNSNSNNMKLLAAVLVFAAAASLAAAAPEPQQRRKFEFLPQQK